MAKSYNITNALNAINSEANGYIEESKGAEDKDTYVAISSFYVGEDIESLPTSISTITNYHFMDTDTLSKKRYSQMKKDINNKVKEYLTKFKEVEEGDTLIFNMDQDEYVKADGSVRFPAESLNGFIDNPEYFKKYQKAEK